ncbi:hypothetical protein L0663_02525 [Dyadobacter sp. CY107]|uniref:hypothetical protein n=1 Tax=Dyadobacter fanqingshengii TaxID=2906443 RepID=UPI001F281C5B|nr:hypothetical protein [Dyadobacter fanqingshengii]MCF2502238.1 hypothetical protein [Dyadobacter fanqingshengii]
MRNFVENFKSNTPMQTTYHMKAGEINVSLLESIKKMFRENDPVALTVQLEKPIDFDQYELFLKSEALQKKFPPIHVNNDTDLSGLANEVNL